MYGNKQKNSEKREFSVNVLKVTDKNSRIRIRIRIHESDVWIRGSGSTQKISWIRNTAAWSTRRRARSNNQKNLEKKIMSLSH